MDMNQHLQLVCFVSLFVFLMSLETDAKMLASAYIFFSQTCLYLLEVSLSLFNVLSLLTAFFPSLFPLCSLSSYRAKIVPLE